jgi:hypothetical protein
MKFTVVQKNLKKFTVIRKPIYRVPYFPDALFWLDGEIVTSGGSYYFKDKTQYGRDFLITGYDFDSAWTTGFPYKSSATISAPAGDTLLIAADVNNFLYTGGVPNQLGVNCMFQDVDYEHRFFTRHNAQVLDLNWVETFEPRVIDIILYATVKTGVDLAGCLTYFGVPTEITTNVRWVSKSGNDATVTASKLAPALTYERAQVLAVNGDVIYWKTGLYTPSVGGAPHNNCLIINKTLDVRAIGNVVSDSPSLNYAIHITGLDARLTGVTVPSAKAGNLMDLSNNGAILRRVKGVAVANNIFSDEGYDYTLENCLMFGGRPITNYAQAIARVVNGGFFKPTQHFILSGNVGSSTITFNYIKVIATGTFGRLRSHIHFLFHNCDLTWGLAFMEFDVNTVGTLKFDYTKFRCTYLLAGTPFIDLTTSLLDSQEFDSCDFLCDNDNLLGLGNTPVAKFNNNKVRYSLSLNTSLKVIVDDTGAGIPCVFEVMNNSQDVAGNNGAMVIGSESGVGYNFLTGVMSRNRIRYYNFFTAHGMFIANQQNVVCQYNNVYGGGLAIGFKSMGGDDYSNSLCSYNLMQNAEFVAKGVLNLRVYNNIVFYDDWCICSGVGKNIDGVNCVSDVDNVLIHNGGLVFRNNIFIYLGTGNFHMVRTDFDVNDYDYNLYYCPNTALKFNVVGVDKTWAEWQALGHDLNGHVLTDAEFNSLFVNYVAENFAINVDPYPANNLGVVHEDGLDSSTDWGDIDNLPVIVTKKQGTIWNHGYFIK